MSSLGSETAKKFIDGCTKCEAVGKSYKSQYNSVNCILLHTKRCIICAGKKSGQLLEEKKKTLDRFGKVVSALRNSGGGQVLIHVEGQIPEDRCLEQFDEFISRSLSDLIDDGELYVDTYKRHWLSDIHEFQGHADYVLVSVKETNGIATVDFNTRVRNDIENVSVTSASLALCMINRPNNKHTKKPKIKGLSENIQDLHESRNNEVKRVHGELGNDITQQISKSPSDFVDYIWHDLKFKDNLTSMSKVEGGGSYYVGISEYTLDIEGYRTKLLNIDGFCTKFKEFEIIRAIKAKLQSDAIALQRNTFCSVPDDLIEVQLYPLPGNERRVLEIAVRYYDGIVFSDKDGPRAYEVKDNTIHRMDKATWLERLKPQINNLTFNMAEQLEFPSKTSDSDESDDSSVPSRYSSEGEVPLLTCDDLSDSDVLTSGDMLPLRSVSITDQRKIMRILSDESGQSFFGIFPAVIEGNLTTKYGHIVQRLRELPDRGCTVIISAGSLLKIVYPSWEGRVPASVLCDVCVFSPTRPVLVLTFTARDGVNQKSIQYNTQLARLIVRHAKEDTKFDFNVVHAAVDNFVCQKKQSFLTRIDQRENAAECICFPADLHMNREKCTAIIKSFMKYLPGDTESETSKQDALVELRYQLHTAETDHDRKINSVNQQYKEEVSQLNYLHKQQKEKLESEIKELILQLPHDRQGKTPDLQDLNSVTRTSSKIEIFPMCSVCQLQFTLKGPVPYLLPCLHAVCETCVTSAARGVISCSTCQREVNLTDTSLQKDAVRKKEIFHLTVKHRPTELLCTHEDDGNQAVCWCQECEEFLCEYCQNMHSSFKLTQNHVVQNFTDMEPTTSNIPTFCGIHKHDSLYLFDISCKKLICARCRIEDHADHEVEKIDVVADTITKQLDHHKNELSKLQAHQQSHMKSIRQGSEATDRTYNTLKESIGHTFQTLRSQLDQREKSLLIALESQTKETKATLHARLNTCEEDWKTCTGVLDYIAKSLLYASNFDILDLGSCVGKMTQICLDTVMPQTHDVPTAVYNTSSLSNLKSRISEFGAILTCEMDGESVKDKDTQTYDFIADLEMKHKMDITELKTKIDEDEKHIESLKLLTDQLNAEIRSLKSRIDEKEKVEKIMDFLRALASEYGVHLLKPRAVDTSMLLKCIHLKYDKDRVNLDKVHINTEGDLVNRKSDTRPAGEGRLKKYTGTCSTAPLPRAGCPQYWEMESRVSLDKPLTGNWLILEVGVCREEQRDVHHCIDGLLSSCCMQVAHCPTHGGICRETGKEGERVLCQPDTLPNTAGTSHTLHYGVVYDDTRKKIVFIDVKENKVMSTLDNVDSSQPLWPMFGVYNPSLLTVSMTLVVGSDINMTEEKKAMIAKALS